MAMLATTSDELQKRKLSQNLAANHYIIFAGILVFSMQLGFALLEAGTVREHKEHSPQEPPGCLPRCLIWWAWGMGAAYGESGEKDGNVFI